MADQPRHLADSPTVNPQGLPRLSQNAIKKLNSMIEAQPGLSDSHLRISVDGGGCAGFTYHFDFDCDVKDDDIVIESDNAIPMLIDKVSLEFIYGAVVDYVDNLGGAYFKITNPNSTSQCGCGMSFSV